MPSLDFETEKQRFKDYYDQNIGLLNDAKAAFVSIINAFLSHDNGIAIAKIEARVKDRDECVKKFTRKYRTAVERKKVDYEIRHYITDLIGLRVVCLYEDDVDKIGNILKEHFSVIDITDKTAEIERTDATFGYKGLHLDLKINAKRQSLPEYRSYAEIPFEIQIRTLIQDSWSTLDHKIKYKKSIPGSLKRRINTLAALFDLADREFKEIRTLTAEEIKKQAAAPLEDVPVGASIHAVSPDAARFAPSTLTAFELMRIANHFFPEFEFNPQKIDELAEEIVEKEGTITKGKFNHYLRTKISLIKKYKVFYEEKKPQSRLSPYTIIRYCLYASDSSLYDDLLTDSSRRIYGEWLKSAQEAEKQPDPPSKPAPR